MDTFYEMGDYAGARRIIAGDLEQGMMLGGVSEILTVDHLVGKVRVTVRAYGRISTHTLNTDEVVIVK